LITGITKDSDYSQLFVSNLGLVYQFDLHIFAFNQVDQKPIKNQNMKFKTTKRHFLKFVIVLSILSTAATTVTNAACAITSETENDADSVAGSSREIFFFVQESPSYPGGTTELKKFFMQNLQYPETAKNNDLEGEVYVRFEVKKDGSIGEVVVSKSVHPVLDSEAIRVVKEMPAWIPGRYDGKAVNSWYTLPISFFLGNGK